jgi:hypothetical protein
MTASLAVFGEKTLRETLCLAAKSCTLSCDSLAFDQVLDQALNVRAVAFILSGFTVAPIAEQLQTLRLERSFRGLILILTFVPEKLSSEKLYGELLKRAECKLLSLPFTLPDFCASISRNDELTDQVLLRMQQQLRTSQAANLASLIAHDYENRFALALVHLRSIENQKYFNPPDLNKIRLEMQQVRRHLVTEKLKKFASALSHLSGLAEPSNARSEIAKVDTLLPCWEKLCESFDRVETSDSGEVLASAFQLSKQLRDVLKRLLSCVIRIKEESQLSLERGN